MYKIYFFMIAVVSLLSLLLTACGGAQPQTEAPIVAATEVAHVHTEEPLATAEVSFEPGAWKDITLIDARTKVEFKISDYSGKVVILEMMDPGCPICKNQLKEIADALAVVGDKAVAISVDIGFKGETALVKWADTNNATWSVSFIPREFVQALVVEFGGEVAYPGNTPIIIIDPSGVSHVTEPGIKTSATLIDLVNQWAQ